MGQRQALYISLCILLTLVTDVTAQSISALPRLLPSYSDDFSDYNTFPSLCFEDAYQDLHGRLWLKTCGAVRVTNASHLFQFDGYAFRLVQDELSGLSFSAKFEGLYQQRQLVGMDRAGGAGQMFFYDLLTGRLTYQSFPQQGRIEDVYITEEDRIFLLLSQGREWAFYEWKDGQLIEQGRILAPVQRPERGIDFYLEAYYHDEKELWLNVAETIYLLRVDKRTGQLRKYYTPDFERGTTPADPQTPAKWKAATQLLRHGAFFISASAGTKRQLYQLDPTSNRFLLVEDIPEDWESWHIFKDQVGNLMQIFKNGDGRYQALIQEQDGKRYDASTFFESLTDIRISQVTSPDFTKSMLICHERGITYHTVKASEAIQHFLPDYSIRAMAQLSEHRFLISTQSNGTHLIDKQNGTATPAVVEVDCAFSQPGPRTRFIPDKEGRYWTHHQYHIIRYDPASNSCTTYPVDASYIHIFTFISPNRLAIIDNRFGLYLYDLTTQRTEPFLLDGARLDFSGYVHDLHYGAGGYLWIATSET